ncbi:DUF4435 domain-containing protein [Enterovibrio norvegicus]|uniref:DUF4435 domain-containing protein n=1 Tax=Enterovibrio norvegicus TaxID=188144 RepID=A0ABV4L387_9GAMM
MKFIEVIDPIRLANQVCMDRGFAGKHLFVEGVKDLKIYPKHLNTDDVKIIVSHGKYKMRVAWDELEKRNEDRKLAIRDADFIRLRDKFNPNYHKSFFITDFHDSEVMITSTRTFENTLLSHLSIAHYQRVSEKYPDLLGELKSLIYPLGNLKLANKLNDLGLIFKPKDINKSPLDLGKFIDFKGMKYLGDEIMVQSVLNFCNGKVEMGNVQPKEAILDSLTEVCQMGYPLNEIVHGHDLSQALALFLKKNLPKGSDGMKTGDLVENCWAGAFSLEDFKMTELYKSLSEWSESSGFSIIK